MSVNIKSPISYFFTDLSFHQDSGSMPDKAFGYNKTENEFQITTTFKTASPAYAVTGGLLFFAKCGNATNKVNILLKPTKEIGLGIKIKYFVYRGIDSSDLFETIGGIRQVKSASNLEFLTNVWDSYTEFYGSTGSLASSKIGFEDVSNISGAEIINKFYAKGNYNLLYVKEGTQIGNFLANSGGFEIVLDDGDFNQSNPDMGLVFDQSFAEAENCILKADGANPGNFVFGGNKKALTNETRVSPKIFRENIYKFLDPAAFYGSHVTNLDSKNSAGVLTNQGGGIIISKGTSELQNKTSNDIYNNIVNRFINKNTVYIYIKNTRGRSYKFYSSDDKQKYKECIDITNLTNPIWTDTSFLTQKWPLIIKSSFNESHGLNIGFSAENIIIKNLVSSNVELHEIKISETDKRSLRSSYLLDDLYQFRFNAAMTNDNGTNVNICCMLYLCYSDEYGLNESFGNINLKSIYEEADFSGNQGSFVSHLRPILKKEGNEIVLYNTKLVLQGSTISKDYPDDTANFNDDELRTYILFPQKSTDINLKINGGIISAGTYLVDDKTYLNDIYNGGEIWRGTLNDSGKNIYTLTYRKEGNHINSPIYQLGISQNEYRLLETKVKTKDSDATNLFFFLEEVKATSTFIKYILKVQFDTKEGLRSVVPEVSGPDDLFLYTVDGYFFFTEKFSENYKYYKEFSNLITAHFLPRDYTGEFGFDWLRKGDFDGAFADKPFNRIISKKYKLSNPTALENNGNEYRGIYKFNALSYFRLKSNEYQSVPVNWKLNPETDGYERDLAVSYLNMFRKTGASNPRAKLRMLLRVKKKPTTPTKAYIKYPKGLFAIRWVDGSNVTDNNPLDSTKKYRILNIPSNKIPGDNSKDFIDLEIEGIGTITDDVEITVHGPNNDVCGKIVVPKNNNIIKQKVLVVLLKDNLPTNTNTLGVQAARPNIVDGIRKFLSHANIEASYDTPYMEIDVVGNAAFQNLKIDYPAPYSLQSGSTTTTHNDNLVDPFVIKTSGNSDVAGFFKEAFKNHLSSLTPAKKVEDYKNHLILVFTDRVADKIAGTNTSTPAFRSDNILFITKNTSSADIGHEFFHGFEIEHTFDNDSDYTYMHGEYSKIDINGELECSDQQNDMTDNIMDYFNDPKKTTYKWQWNIMRKQANKIK